MSITRLWILAGIVFFCCVPLSLCFPREIQAEYQEKEYQLVEHEDMLLSESWPEEYGFGYATFSYPLDLEENWEITIHILCDHPFGVYHFTIEEEWQWSENRVYEIERSGSVNRQWIVPKTARYYFTVKPISDPDMPQASGTLQIGKPFSTWEWVDVTKTRSEFNPNILYYSLFLFVLGTISISIGLLVRQKRILMT